MYSFSRQAGFFRQFRVATAVLVVGLALAACASVPPPNDSMNLAQNMLQAARDAGAADYAPVDLGFAQDKFQQAQAAMAARNFADAASLAEESSADAELARTKARLGAARAQMQGKLQENTRLRHEGEQLQAEQNQMEQAAPVPASSSSAASPVRDMPAPSASVLSAPGDGELDNVPDDSPSPPSSAGSYGEQP
ncbi:MAG TPA: DUF4398 domain-containing protein [Rhodanobacter sp.]|jgi:hypothetical protein|nr:DUF4398 domain-containing protein [Rhodanobacter sp.]